MIRAAFRSRKLVDRSFFSFERRRMKYSRRGSEQCDELSLLRLHQKPRDKIKKFVCDEWMQEESVPVCRCESTRQVHFHT